MFCTRAPHHLLKLNKNHYNYVKVLCSTSIKSSQNDKIAENVLTLPPVDLTSEVDMTLNTFVTSLSNFKNPKEFYRRKILEGNRELKHIYSPDASTEKIFRKIFPEIVESRGITKLQQLDLNDKLFDRWKEGNNDVTVELAQQSDSYGLNKKQDRIKDEHFDALFIGGPSTMVACLLYQFRYPKHRVQHVYANRFDSNYDGSAYYYHQRDAAPVYINPVNRGPYCVYIDLYKRLIKPETLAHQAETNRHHVKISLSWANIKPRHLFTIFIPNVWHMCNDLWIKNKRKSNMAHVIQHACRAVPIIHTISQLTGVPVEQFLIRGKNKANYVGLNGSKKNPKCHFTWLNKFAPIPFHEISTEGFGAEVKQVLNFPNDGLMSPMFVEHLLTQIEEHRKLAEPDVDRNVSRHSFVLKKMYVQPTSPEQCTRMRVVEVEWIDNSTGATYRTTADRYFISLGPSGQFRIVPPSLTWFQHFKSVFNSNSKISTHVGAGYMPTLSSLWRHSLNVISNKFFRGDQCLKDFIMASGNSCVMLLGVDLTQTTPAQLDVLSRFVDGVNQHWTLIAQRDVVLSETVNTNCEKKKYRFFAIQMTGGGNFPSRLVRPDYLLNLLYTTEKMYGLNVMKHAVYDIIQSRGCGRAVSARNTISFQNLADNAVVNYALGGIGMTTMFSNGEKMVEMIEKNDSLLDTNKKRTILFDHLLEGIDYSSMLDESQRVARAFGFDNTLSKREKAFLGGSGLAVLFSYVIYAFI